MKNKIWFIISRGSILFLLYLSLFKNNIAIFNLVKFYVGMNFALWLFIFLNPISYKYMEKNKYSTLKQFNIFYAIIFSGMLASQGYFIYATLSFLTMIIQGAISNLIEKKNNE